MIQKQVFLFLVYFAAVAVVPVVGAVAGAVIVAVVAERF